MSPLLPTDPRKSALRALLVLLAVLALTGCPPGDADQNNGDQPDAGVDEQAIPVEVEAVREGPVSQTLLSTATVAARREILILSETQGTIRDIKVEEGDAVKAGQLLARMSNPELEMTIPTAATNVSRLRREVDTLKPLVDKGYVSRQSYEEMRFQLTQARDQLARARAQVADLSVKTPISGLVARRSVNPGQQISPGMELFYVVDPEDLEVVVNVPERSLGQITEGNTAYAISDAMSDARFEGRIRLINPVVNPQTGTVKVTVALDATTEASRTRLRPGMFVSVYLITQERPKATLVSKRALVYKDDRPFLFVSDTKDGAQIARLQPIDVGFSEQDSVEITKGVQPGDKVVVLGQSGLKDGAEIKVVE